MLDRPRGVIRALQYADVWLVSCAGAYLANQLDGKIFDNPGLMPSKTAYSDFVQTKVCPCNQSRPYSYCRCADHNTSPSC